MSLTRQLLVAVVAPTLALSLAACGSGPAADEDEVDESKLVVYSGREESLVQPVIDRFEKETGIEVSVRYGDTAELAAQLLEEGERAQAGAFFAQDAGALGALGKAGMLATLPQETLGKVPDEYRADDGRWVGLSGRARVIVYDPRQVPENEVPDSVFELTDPKWKGKVGVAPTNASFEAFVTAMRVLQGEEKTRGWLEGMKANAVQTFDKNSAILNATDDGTIQLGLINHYYWFEKVAESGQENVPSRLRFLPGGDPGALVNVAGVGVVDQTDQAEPAQRFVDYLLSPQAQQYFAEETWEYPLAGGVSTAPGLPALSDLQTPDMDLSDLDTLEQTLELIEQVGLT